MSVHSSGVVRPTKSLVLGSGSVASLLIVISIVIFCIAAGPLEMLVVPTFLGIVCGLAILIAGLPWTWRNLPLPFYVISSAINGCCVFYIVASWWAHETSFSAPESAYGFIALAAGLLAFRWPVLGFIPALIVSWSKRALVVKFGMPVVGSADYIIIPDLALMMSIFIAVYSAYQLMSKTFLDRLRDRFALEINADSFFAAAVIAAAGIHFSNYFWSGWAKLFLSNSSPWTWVLENPTYILAVHAGDMNFLTIQTLLGGSDAFYRILVLLNVPLNVLVLLSQLLAVVVLLSLRASAVTTVFYDIMHAAIFALTGIFFWKWIVLNAGFVIAFRHIHRNGPTLPRSVLILGCGLVLLSPMFFHIVRLGWFDSGGVNDAQFKARTDSGELLTVPSNFFLGNSIRVAQQRLSRSQTGFLPTGTWGTTGDGRAMSQLSFGNCRSAANPDWKLSDNEQKVLARFLEQRHRVAIGLAGDDGKLLYDAYPHHIWSSPWHFPAFASVDLRTVKSYVLVIESRCVSVSETGRIQRDVVGQSQYEFPVRSR